ncbi:MAG: carboxypeptidase-like regulatory domain-containing protein [Saprospiraceae bacterium]|nr:carboxypeptidase-like regulatory domain-containing protein [Saprospiraceae bacterium]
MGKYLSLFLFVLITFPAIGQFLIKGKVTNEQNSGLAFVSVFDSTYKYSAVSNEDGFFEIKLPSESLRLNFQLLGYETRTLTVRVDEANIIKLKEIPYALPEVEYVAGEDPAVAIMKAAISKRKQNAQAITTFKADVYGKVLVRLDDAPEKFLGQDLGDMGGILDTNRQGIIYLSETVSNIKYLGGEWKETVKASKVSGDNAGLTFNSFSKTIISFYDETIDFDRAYISPLHDRAFSYYDFYLIRTFKDETDHDIHVVRVRPKSKFDPCFNGYIYLSQSDLQLTGVDLSILKEALKTVFLDTLKVQQVFKPNQDDHWFTLSQNIGFSINVFGFITRGYANYLYVDQNFQPEFKKSDFGAEVYKIEENASRANDEYWSNIRPLPLTLEEQLDYTRKDSLQIIWESDAFLDSLDRVNNKFKPTDLFFGYSAGRLKKNESFGVASPMYNLQFNAVEGFNLRLPLYYEKSDSNGLNNMRLAFYGKYGFSDQRFKYGASLHKVYNAKKLGKYNFTLVDDLEHYDGRGNLSAYANSFQSLYYKTNYARFYRRRAIMAKWQEEIYNGFVLSIGADLSSRTSVGNASNFALRNQEKSYKPNNIRGLENYMLNDKAFKFDLNIKWRIGQKFSDLGSIKIRETGKWPDLLLKLITAIPLDGSYVSYSKLLVQLEHENISAQRFGFGRASVEFGRFISKERVSDPDLFHFQGNELSTAFVSNYLRGYRLMPYYQYSSTDPYISAFYEHHFDGFIMDKIPLINRKGIQMVTNGAALIRQKDRYYELGLGLEGFSIGPIDLLRFDYIWSFGMDGYLTSGFKLGLSTFFERDFKL